MTQRFMVQIAITLIYTTILAGPKLVNILNCLFAKFTVMLIIINCRIAILVICTLLLLLLIIMVLCAAGT